MPINPADPAFLAGATPDELLQTILGLRNALTPAVDKVFEELFARMDRGQLRDWPMLADFLKLSDTLAVSSASILPSTKDHFSQHKDEKQWSGFDGADLKFDMKDFDPELKNKIIADIKQIAGTDQVEDKDSSGNVIGIKISDPIAKANMEIYLAHLSTPEVEKSAKKVKSIPAQLLKDVGWAAWQETWDDFQKKVIAQKSPEDMGKTFCEGVFLMPFKGAANLMNKLDKWIIKRAQLAKQERESGAPGAPGTPGAPGDPGVDPNAVSGEEYAGQRLEFYKLMAYHTNLHIALMREAATNPKAKALADAVEEMLSTQAPPTHYRGDFGKDLNDYVPYLLADSRNQALRDALDGLPASAMPDDLKNEYNHQAMNIVYGLTPDRKNIIDGDTFAMPTVNTADSITETVESITSPKYGNGTKKTYRTSSGELLTEETYSNASGQVVIKKSGDIYLEQHLDSANKVTAQTLKRGNEESISFESPNKIATMHEGRECHLHDVPSDVYQGQFDNAQKIVDKINNYQNQVQTNSRPDPALTGHDRFITGAKEVQKPTIVDFIQTGRRPNPLSAIHDHLDASRRPDGTKYGIVIDESKKCIAHFSQKTGKDAEHADYICCYPKNNVIVKVTYGKNNRERMTIYDFNGPIPTSKVGNREVPLSPANITKWKGFLQTQGQLLDAAMRDPTRSPLLTTRLNSLEDSVMQLNGRGRTH